MRPAGKLLRPDPTKRSALRLLGWWVSLPPSLVELRRTSRSTPPTDRNIKRRSIGSAFCNSALPAIPGLAPATLPARPNCENRGFAGMTVSGHFAKTGPVLGGRPRAGPVPVHLVVAPGPLRDDVAGDGSPRGHFARSEPVGASSRAAPAPGHLAPPVRAQLARTRTVCASLLRPPRPGIA